MQPEEYNEKYAETGSSNISKASPEWAKVIEEAKRLLQPGEYLITKGIEIINRQVADGFTSWAKCINCGSPFIVKTSSEICSDSCAHEYSDYLNSF